MNRDQPTPPLALEGNQERLTPKSHQLSAVKGQQPSAVKGQQPSAVKGQELPTPKGTATNEDGKTSFTLRSTSK